MDRFIAASPLRCDINSPFLIDVREKCLRFIRSLCVLSLLSRVFTARVFFSIIIIIIIIIFRHLLATP